MSEKALKACADYARLNAEIKKLTREIRDCLGQCRGVVVEHEPGSEEDGLLFASSSETHLKKIYRGVIDDDCYEPYIRYLSETEIRQRLFAECEYCLAAHHAIQMRKAARRSLGATKAFITRIGRAAK